MVPFIGPSYHLATRKADVQRSVNLFPVMNEVIGGKTQSYLQSVPGLDVFSDVPQPVYPCGVLCHFEHMDGEEVVSAIGPNFARIGPAALDAGVIRPAALGSSSGNCGALGEFIATGITCPNDSNFRAEGFFWHTGGEGQCFELGGSIHPSVYPAIKIYKGPDFMTSACESTIGFSSQILYYVPPVGEWFHIAIQYCCDPADPDYHRLFWFANGARMGEMIGGGETDHFEDSVFGSVKVGGNAVAADEFWLQFHVPTADLYRDTYTVPTAPFAPPDPA